ncbi:hypothetical protein [Ancylobacter radicis]|uniref:Uncharacterized protein n=1 Tax=Ancylobacter radicis TaxID=2836179 RepID=A0ABS5RBF5_9HYPH|nr:hypothetical protein [Ancylobacter radicis]MBS9478989.1 hypothetical protein [Ancylobacter radicis]
MSDLIFATSIEIEKGRLFFKNHTIDDFGKEKKEAYRGYRPLILDQLVVAHQIACEFPEANDDERLRMELVAEDCLKTFVSMAQKEVGRDRTASADTRQGGDGAQLWHRMQDVNERQLSRLRIAQSNLVAPSRRTDAEV